VFARGRTWAWFAILAALIYTAVGCADSDTRSPSRAPAGDEITQSRENAIVRAAREVGPAIVSISVIQTRVVRTSPLGPGFRDEFFEYFFRDFFPERLYRQEIPSLGSGVLVSESERSYVLTNDHVVHGADVIKVTLADGREFDAQVVGTDPRFDLAVLTVNGEDLPSARLGDSNDLVTGEWAIAIGNPFGYLLADRQPTVTVGVVSALHRDVKPERDQIGIYKDMIQTDAAINPGNSGGALVNSAGEIIGINTFIFTKSGGSLGIGFAIPINTARRVMKEFVNYGRVRPVWVGVQVQEITPLLARSMELESTEGVLISHVDEGSPAEKAGVERGDLLQKVGDKTVHSVEEAQRALADAIVDDDIGFHIIRRGDECDLVLHLVERSEGARK
jgi:serine protease Do